MFFPEKQNPREPAQPLIKLAHEKFSIIIKISDRTRDYD